MADPTPKLPPMPEADDKMVAAMVREMFDCRRYSEPWEGVMRRCYAAAVKAAPIVSEAAQSVEQARELSDEEIDRLIQQHVDPVATYKRLHNFARGVLAAAGAHQSAPGGTDG